MLQSNDAAGLTSTGCPLGPLSCCTPGDDGFKAQASVSPVGFGILAGQTVPQQVP